jgi:hypothetical protein
MHCVASLVEKQCRGDASFVVLTWGLYDLQVRAVARKAAALREAEKQLAAAEADKAAKEQGLVKAKEAQVCWHYACRLFRSVTFALIVELQGSCAIIPVGQHLSKPCGRPMSQAQRWACSHVMFC